MFSNPLFRVSYRLLRQHRTGQNALFHSSTPNPFLKRMFDSTLRVPRMLSNIYAGDDHVNPKKVLERRYLYFVLLATRLRTMRLSEAELADDDVLYERAIEELDKEGIDGMTNAQLRIEMQQILEPQVTEAFQAFDEVDQRLGILNHSFDNADGPFAGMDWGPYREILQNEYETTVSALGHVCSGDDSSGANQSFLTRKKEALDLLLDFHNMPPSDTSIPTDTIDAFGTDLSTVTSDTSLELIRSFQTLNVCRSSLIREELGFSILLLKSAIPNAGRGVFIDGKALRGSLVAIQPGEIWPKEHLLTSDPETMAHFDGDDDCQISLRFDDYILDTRQSPVTVLTSEGSMNPWAIGHMVNHPEEATFPNCQSTMLNYTERMNLRELSRYVPNYYARPPGWQSRFFFPEPILMHGLCLVARRDIQNEELLYDYRLQSEITPEWYSVVRYSGDDMDDEQVVFFRDDWNGQ